MQTIGVQAMISFVDEADIYNVTLQAPCHPEQKDVALRAVSHLFDALTKDTEHVVRTKPEFITHHDFRTDVVEAMARCRFSFKAKA